MRNLAMCLLASLGSTGCLSVPEGPEPQCASSSDCDRAHGEVCEEGVCWGNPPAGPFAAIVSPPIERRAELISRELMELPIPDYGWVGDIALEEPVSYSATLQALCPAPVDCTNLALGATITLTRPSLFPGGPGFRAEVVVDPANPQFKLTVPRTRMTDEPFTVTVVPAGRNDPASGPTSAAALLPPTRFTVEVKDNTAGKVVELGAPNLAIVEGAVTQQAAGVKDFRVVALGRWQEGESLTEVSTVAYTRSDGKFTLRLAPDLVGPVEIVAKPFGESEGLPTLHLANISNSGASGRSLTVPTLGNRVEVAIPVTGVDGNGVVGPIEGARVTISSDAPQGQNVSFPTLSVSADTGPDGIAKLKVFDNPTFASTYRISIVPPAGSESGVVFDEPFQLALVGTTQPPLPSRVAVRGVVRDASGEPLSGVGITARPSLRFQWSLADAPQAFLTGIPTTATVTFESGEFVVWVDPLLAGVFGYYDLFFEPPQDEDAKIQAPALLLADFELPRDGNTVVTVPDVILPAPAFIHGRITTPGGAPVEGAELKLFRVQTQNELCGQVSNAPRGCQIPALLLGRGASDTEGTVRFSLPR